MIKYIYIAFLFFYLSIANSEVVKRSTIFERWTEKFKEFLDKA